MSLTIKCDCCQMELDQPGGLAFDPPNSGACRKRHLCVYCWDKFEDWFRERLQMKSRGRVDAMLHKRGGPSSGGAGQ